MTGTGIADFLAKATGPAELVSGLRTMTRGLGGFFKEVSHMDSLQAKIPPGVLEGGLSGLLSKRLQQLLDYSQQPGELENKNPANRSSFTNPFQIEDAHKNKSLFNADLAEDTIKDFAPGKPGAEIKDNEFKPFPLPQEENEKTTALPGQYPQAVQGHWEYTAGLPGSDSPSLPSKETSTGGEECVEVAQNVTFPGRHGDLPLREIVGATPCGRPYLRNSTLTQHCTGGEEHEGRTPGYIFVEKLNEYFQLNRQEPSPEPGTHPFPAVDRGRGKRNQGKAPAFPNAAAETRRPGPGFKMTEEQVARELRAFIDGRSDISPVGRSGQVFSTNGTGDGDIRIQNTFNINLDHDGTREAGPLGSLTEKIADILREQAIQHGIDIT